MSRRWLLVVVGLFALVSLPTSRALAEPPKAEEAPAPHEPPDPIEELKKELAATKKSLTEHKTATDDGAKAAEKASADAATLAKERGDTAWMLISSALVLVMVPGLALFYGGMVRRKNVLATMMQSMAALAV